MNSHVHHLPSESVDTIKLAQDLVRLDTTNPPGSEVHVVALLADRLHKAGIAVEAFEFAPGRTSMIARLNAGSSGPALCLSGHLDTVPLGKEPWTGDPLGGEIIDGRMFGRGTTDMKCGVAAMVTAFERLHRSGSKAKIVLALSSSEETGCQGAAQMAPRLGAIGAIVIAEPTSGRLAVGHKGVLWLKLITSGKAAHASMPHLGRNSVDLMADAIMALRGLDFGVDNHPLLGCPTYNVGTVSGGSAVNIVPDTCECLLDVRLVPGLGAESAKTLVERCIGSGIEIETLLALDAVASDPEGAWLRKVSDIASEIHPSDQRPMSVPYFTDASVLGPALGFPPVVILGPGDPALAHQVNESCSVPAIWSASLLYERLGRDWAENKY
ncbi:M20 family metallopeptidase [Paracoccus sp. SCSIO 75233]|uniref:M20 family metallopeptidase n=1 Tax=Paracoccus sp. SCSIO 75233 TaxID=3017782 RepID=UPI0022F07A36|nr:M20 family metallopeptidase [Paracoccus sp. SCSIO 75233]WBU55319.1 M20 family metallopeptidase [Paracoccus sp. SCSIO 75233]